VEGRKRKPKSKQERRLNESNDKRMKDEIKKKEGRGPN
jgi:hypothetical protein